MKEFKFLPNQSKKDYCDTMPYKEFMDCVRTGGFIPYDGTIGEVYVDDKVTNIDVAEFGGLKWELADVLGKDIVLFTLEELGEIKGKVEICWCNK